MTDFLKINFLTLNKNHKKGYWGSLTLNPAPFHHSHLFLNPCVCKHVHSAKGGGEREKERREPLLFISAIAFQSCFNNTCKYDYILLFSLIQKVAFRIH